MNNEVKILNLDEFVRQAITDIGNGLQCAQEEGQTRGVKVSFSEYVNSPVSVSIQFDLVVDGKVEVSQDGEMKSKISCFSFEADKMAKIDTKAINRLQFTIPVVFFADNSSASSF